MPDLFWIEYELIIEDRQEFSGDDPRLEFFFVNIVNGTARATVVDTGIVEVNAPGVNDPSGRAIIRDLQAHPPIAPTAQDPYLGFAARAWEYDDTSSAERNRSQDATLARLEETFNEILGAGNRPGVNDLWLTVNTAPGVSRAGDEDELIGVSARVYPIFGTEVTRNGVRRNVIPTGSQPDDSFAFSRSSAVWRMPFRLSHQSL